MTKTQMLANLRKIIALAEPMRPDYADADTAELQQIRRYAGGIVVNAEDLIEELEASDRDSRLLAWEANFLGALKSGNFAINGKRVRS